MRKKAVCIFSGGPDSMAAAYVAQTSGYQCYFLTVDYGQKTAKREVEAAKRLALYFNTQCHKIVKLPFLKEIGGSGITDDIEFLTKENAPREYVPFRNTIFLSLAVAWAETIGAEAIFIGSIGGPWLTPDNSPEYFAAFQKVTNIGTEKLTHIEIIAPFCQQTKRDVVEFGIKNNLPFGLTWTCQNRSDLACGECSNCRDRLTAFKTLDIEDPIPYVTIL